jgi:hypothetical protein
MDVIFTLKVKTETLWILSNDTVVSMLFKIVYDALVFKRNLLLTAKLLLSLFPFRSKKWWSFSTDDYFLTIRLASGQEKTVMFRISIVAARYFNYEIYV